MKRKLLMWVILTAMAATSLFSAIAGACTIGEDMSTQVPFGATDISNADRLVIANMYIKAKTWPNVQIRAEVIAGAYKSERPLERLKAVRGENIRAYLLMLGIKPENILIDTKTFTDAMTSRASDGSLVVEQIVVGLTPLCEGSCARLCNDPRVTPNTKLIQ
jgi:hypothetical protein